MHSFFFYFTLPFQNYANLCKVMQIYANLCNLYFFYSLLDHLQHVSHFSGCHLLLQDRRCSGRRCHPRRSSSCYHDLSCTRHTSHGQEERHRPQSSIRRDPWLHFRYLLRQNRNTDHKSDVCLQGMFSYIIKVYFNFKLRYTLIWHTADYLWDFVDSGVSLWNRTWKSNCTS